MRKVSNHVSNFVLNQKVQKKELMWHSWFFLMQWLGTLKYTILKFQNLWNLINVLIKKIWKYLFNSFKWFFKVLWVQ